MRQALLLTLLGPTIMATTIYAGGFNSNGAYIEGVAFGGNGCPQGTVNAIMNEDGSAISVFFDEYMADSSTNRYGMDRKSCNVGVTVHVPQGFSVALLELDYRGYVSVPYGGRAELTAEYFYAGQPVGTKVKEIWGTRYKPAPIDTDFSFRDTFVGSTMTWSPCGQSVILRANTSIKANAGYEKARTYIQVDTVDTHAELIYLLQWRSCR
ncbi:MAG: DUF4360 domain-containing protein [Oligoflexales bacterium]|nr:DUF4360 domain-containing protein [Oligoflexales bacterium]